MSNQKWGRNEATLWPRRGMFHTLGALIFSFVLCTLFIYLRYSIGLSSLQRFYLRIYVRSAALTEINQSGRYSLLFVSGDKGKSRIAVEDDLEPGTTFISATSSLPFVLSDRARSMGLSHLFLEPKRAYNNRQLYEYLRQWAYGQRSLASLFAPALWGGLGILILQLFYVVPLDLKRRRELRYGRRLKGPDLFEAKQFNTDSTGIVFSIKDKPGYVGIPRRLEDSHFLVMGDNGTGKSSLIRQMLLQIHDRSEGAVIYDPALEYVAEFYDSQRGDVILNPLDARMPFWNPGAELEDVSEATAIAESLFPQHEHENPFFVEGPRKIFAHLLSFRPSAAEIAYWMSNPREIEDRVRGTELEPFLDPKSPNQRGGILASLNMVGDAFKCLPKQEIAQGKWTARAWASDRRGWIFLTSKPVHRKRLLPLTSLWLDMLILRLMSDRNNAARRVWFVLDELASLQRLPQLHTAVTENRKSGNPLVLGFHGRSQLEARYGRDAEAMLSQPATKIFLRTSEARAAEWVSKMIGEVEIERLRESHHQGPRQGRAFSLERLTEPLVMASEVSGLRDMHAYMKIENSVTRFEFPYIELPRTAAGFVPRKIEPDAATVSSAPAHAVEEERIEESPDIEEQRNWEM